MKKLPLFFALAAGAVAVAALPAVAAELPKATQKMLKALKMKPSILSGLDKELAVPQAWIDGAKKEGKVRIYTTMRPKPWKKMHDILKERYPYITFEHSEVRGASRRWVRPLAAFKEGRVITDVIMDFSGNVFSSARPMP